MAGKIPGSLPSLNEVVALSERNGGRGFRVYCCSACPVPSNVCSSLAVSERMILMYSA